jgi:hypothetical protein
MREVEGQGLRPFSCSSLPRSVMTLDIDNGGEFINEAVIAYCEQERITFTRDAPI